MYLPPLQPIANSEIQICGDVEIHPTASIAPGVILKAAPNARIIIGADACLGMGVIISAHDGSIEIEAGVTLGSGVLIIGSSKIGANSCIGTTTTIFNASIAAMTVVNPGSIIGDHSRSWQENNNDQGNTSREVIDSETKVFDNGKKATPENNRTTDRGLVEEPTAIEEEINPEISNLESDPKVKKATQQEHSLTDQGTIDDSANIADSDPWEEEEIPIMTSQVEVEKKDQNPEISPGVAIGKVYIDQLLVTLFPHNNSLNNNSNNNGK